jgi:hypothetical protein
VAGQLSIELSFLAFGVPHLPKGPTQIF